MYNFAVTILLGLATIQVVSLIEAVVADSAKWRSLTTLVVAIAGAFVVDYSLFEGFGVALRNADVATVATGFVVAGTAGVWRTVLGYLGAKDDTSGKGTLASHKIAA